MALLESLVETIFARMAIRYGAAWIAKWKGVPKDAVKADWAHELGGLGTVAITHGLMHLPDEFPPSVGEFKRLCLGRSEPERPRLPAPKPDPARLAALLRQVHDGWQRRKPLQWAYDLQEREKAGDNLSVTQQAAWRMALQQGMDESIVGAFSPIPVELWPPGMAEHCGRVAPRVEQHDPREDYA